MKKFLSFALIAIIALMSVLMTACNTNGVGSSLGNNGNRVERPKDDTVYSERELVDDELPEMKFGGREFHIIARDSGLGSQQETGVGLEQIEDVLSNTIYARNKEVEERFNVNITATYSTSPCDDVKKTVRAGLPTYDLCIDQVIKTCTTATDGTFYAVDELEYVNLDKPWYIKSATDAISVAGKSFFIAGDMLLTIYRFTYCVFFNADIGKKYPEVEDLYTVVEEGRWTIDYMSELVKKFYYDINGNGEKDPEDQFGLASDWHSSIHTYNYSFDNPIMRLDEDGIPQVAYNTPKTVAIVEKLYELFRENKGTFAGTWGVTGGSIHDNRAFLWNGRFESTEGHRSDDFEFGMIPYPKYDEMQERYYTMADGNHSIMAVPITADAEFASIIIEALNAGSYKKVIPAYYENELKLKGARGDERAAEMIELISSGLSFDFGFVYGGIGQLLMEMISNGNSNFASEYDKNESAAIKQYNSVIEKYLDMV